MASLIARKRLTYAGRNIRPGVAFSAKPAHARVLVAAGVAGFVREPAPILQVAACRQAEPQNVMCVDHGSDVEFLRATYEARTGRKPDKRWGAARLRKEMANQ